jgi:hypothetical protein
MPRKATSARARSNFKLEVSRSDGSSIVIDVAAYLDRGVFRDLRDEELFNQVTIDAAGGAEWPNGASLPPELLAVDQPVGEGAAAVPSRRG